ncbi:MAG: class I SAM-dependent methyltransferase [Acidobacteria bacterium]|nr:class I SAM-dependent methyltransferase [Acidobacteriota bacterium]
MISRIRDRIRWLRLYGRAWFSDAADLFRARPEYGLPPRRKRAIVGAGDFEPVGRKLADLAVRFGEVDSGSHVVDWGCGWGRATIPLARIITDGSYLGVDVDSEAIRWCRSSIGAINPRFDFFHLDVPNAYYHPDATGNSESFSIPVLDESVDVVLAFSLFTHLRPHDAIACLDEIRRVLRPGGRLVMTHYLLTEDRIEKAKSCPNAPQFRYRLDDSHRSTNDRVPESAIGVHRDTLEATIRGRFARFEIRDGAWDCTPDTVSYQDLIVAQLRARPHSPEGHSGT